MSKLVKKKCEPCEGGIPPIGREAVERYMEEVDGWELELVGEEGERYGVNRRIKREFEFKNFEEAMGFVKDVAELAEREGHHPNIHIYYNKVVLELTTHAIDGLSENDFILAAKVDRLK